MSVVMFFDKYNFCNKFVSAEPLPKTKKILKTFLTRYIQKNEEFTNVFLKNGSKDLL